MRRRARRRRLGAGLVLFGLSGVGLAIAGGVLVLASLSAVNDAATGFERQREAVLGMLGPASDALSNAATSASNASTSLGETSEAASRAAQLTTRLAESFEGLTALGSFELFGARPFQQLSGQFAEVGTQARALSSDLDAAADAMALNIADSQAVAEDLRNLAAQLDRLEAGLGTPIGGAGSGGLTAESPLVFQINAARIVLLGLLLWLAIPALGCIWIGQGLLRARPRRDEDD